jgi:hypothetical protein
MDNPEQYLLQVLRRTLAGLQDSLIPFHAGKMQQLTEKFEQAPVLKDEIRRLLNVNGFTKAALSMQWVMERVENSGEDFSPDQFDADAMTLSDKMFEAFLSEPFDAPAEIPAGSSRETPLEVASDVVPQPIIEEPQQDQSELVPLAEIPIESPASSESLSASQLDSQSQPEFQPQPESLSQPEFQLQPDSQSQPELQPQPESQPQPEPEAVASPPPPVEETPALTDLLDQNLLLGFQRFTEIVSKLGEKTPAERKSVFAVLAMIAKSSAEVAHAQGKKDVLDFFQSVIRFITYVDTSGSAQDSRVAEIMRDVGDRLSKALKERSNGAALLQSINQILQNPEGTLKS